jgi:1-phosphofructokinase family hexose kinase
MILCVCLNPALDVTYAVTELTYGGTHRAQVVGRRAGGKALNVARVLHQLGEPVLATGLAGGADGGAVLADLAELGVAAEFAEIEGESRRTVTVYDGRQATEFDEVGPVVGEAEWGSFRSLYTRLLAGTTLVVISGSQPPGVPVDAYGELTTLAAAAGATVVLDAAGPALRAALAARPDVVKPNRLELAELVGRTLDDLDDVLAASGTLVEAGAGSVLVSLGADGLVALTPDGAFRARLPAPVAGNPTGAGDALAAAVVRGLRRGDDWPSCLVDGVAVAAASVAVGQAGATDEALAAKLRPTVQLEKLR